MIEDRSNIWALIIVFIGLILIAMGSMKMLDAKTGVLTSVEHKSCMNFTVELIKDHSEYLKFDPEPYTTCQEGVLKRNFYEALKWVMIGIVMVLSGILIKVFFIK